MRMLWCALADLLPSAFILFTSAVKTTGHKALDDAAVAALRQWRSWKDIVRVVMVPIVFAPEGEKKVKISK